MPYSLTLGNILLFSLHKGKIKRFLIRQHSAVIYRAASVQLSFGIYEIFPLKTIFKNVGFLSTVTAFWWVLSSQSAFVLYNVNIVSLYYFSLSLSLSLLFVNLCLCLIGITPRKAVKLLRHEGLHDVEELETCENEREEDSR